MGNAKYNVIPETAAEALARWDAGDGVFTAEMGGLGPGYEQVIHVAAFEFVRELLTRTLPDWDDEPAVKKFVADVARIVDKKINNLGMSGAQYGAAQNLAYRLVRVGWAKGLSELPDDRKIQVSKTWPSLEARS